MSFAIRMEFQLKGFIFKEMSELCVFVRALYAGVWSAFCSSGVRLGCVSPPKKAGEVGESQGFALVWMIYSVPC